MLPNRMQNTLISFVLPAFKSEFLEQAINSILNQTYENFELIIVNDCSPDNVEEIVYSFKDKRIKYYENEKNIGGTNLIDNWNLCTRFANGEYLILASDDDIYSPDFLMEMHTLSLKYPLVDLFHCRIKMINSENEIISISSPCNEFETCLDFMNQRVNYRRLQVAPDFMLKTSSLKAIGGFVDFPLAWYSDEVTWYLLAKDKGVVYSPKILFGWRSSEINISSKVTNTEKKIEAAYLYKQWVIDFVKIIEPKNEIDSFLKKRLLEGVIVATDAQICFDLKDSSFKDFIKISFNKKYHRFITSSVFFKSSFGRLKDILKSIK